MRIERLRKEIEVFNKLDGRKYKVVAVDGKAGTAKEMLEDGELGEATVSINEANCLAFRITADPAPYPVPEGYSVSEGILLKDGEAACEQGQIALKEIMAKGPGMLIISGETKEAGLIDLYSYEPARDRFSKLLSGIPETVLVGYAGADKDEAIFAFSKTTEETRKKEDGTDETVKVFDEAYVFAIKNGSICMNIHFQNPILTEEIVVAEYPDATGYELFVPYAEYVNDKGVVEALDNRTWIHCVCGYIRETLVMNSLTASWSPMYKEFILRGKEEVYVPSRDLLIKSKKVPLLAAYPTLIDITKEEYTYRLTFSNADYEFKTLISKSTRDRGCIVSIE